LDVELLAGAPEGWVADSRLICSATVPGLGVALPSQTAMNAAQIVMMTLPQA
jgi:hypothetical protein